MSQEQEIRADFAKYTDRFGLVQPTCDPEKLADHYGASGNGLVYTSAKILCYWRRGMLNDADKVEFRDVVISCWQDMGLLKRSPTKDGEQNGWDDYTAVVAAAKVAAPSVAHAIRDYARAHGYVFNNEKPGTVWTKKPGSAIFGRYPQFIAHLEYATGNTACVVNEFAWEQHVTSKPEDEDGAYLRWMMLVTRFPSGTEWQSWGAFKHHLYARYCGGIGQVWSEYFKDGGHPLAKWGVT